MEQQLQEGYWKANGCQIEYYLNKSEEEGLWEAANPISKKVHIIEEDRSRLFLQNHSFIEDRELMSIQMEDYTKERLIDKLKQKYPDTNFKVKDTDNFIEIIYDNEKYKFDKNFKQGVTNVCKEYLSKIKMYRLAVTYGLI